MIENDEPRPDQHDEHVYNTANNGDACHTCTNVDDSHCDECRK